MYLRNDWFLCQVYKREKAISGIKMAFCYILS
jgi:hypothetical protein